MDALMAGEGTAWQAMHCQENMFRAETDPICATGASRRDPRGMHVVFRPQISWLVPPEEAEEAGDASSAPRRRIRLIAFERLRTCANESFASGHSGHVETDATGGVFVSPLSTTSTGGTLRSCLGLRCDEALRHLNGRSSHSLDGIEGEDEEDGTGTKEEDSDEGLKRHDRSSIVLLRPDQKEWLSRLFRGDVALHSCLLSHKSAGRLQYLDSNDQERNHAVRISQECIEEARKKYKMQ